MNTKICSKCCIEKNIDEFAKDKKTKDGLKCWCKLCNAEYNKKYRQEHKEQIINKRNEYIKNNKEKIRQYKKDYRIKNKERIIEHSKEYYKLNKEKINKHNTENYYKNREERSKKSKIYYQKNKEYKKTKANEYYYNNIDEIHLKQKDYYQRNKDILKKQAKKYRDEHIEERKKYAENYRKNNRHIINKRHNERMKQEPIYYLKHRIRALIRKSFIRRGQTKSKRTEEILGCSIDFFINYLIKTYEDNYNEKWDWKYLKEVHIDHIKPLAEVNTKEEVIELCHYTNLQLLKAKDNLDKKDSLEWELKQ